ncbi:MAG: GNAT family N-acetyltransferase [Magnetospirillum sp. WYHS-4]
MQSMRFGNFEVRLAETALDLDAAQALRYHVFYDEMGARPTPEMERLRRDFDRFDELCDHLLVIDIDQREASPFVVGTYRLRRRSALGRGQGFYTAGEFDLGPLMSCTGEVMELGRSCVHPAYRGGAVMQILWRGLAEYVFRHEVGWMFGCASFPGIDPAAHAQAFSYLHHCHRAPRQLRPSALGPQAVDMDLLPRRDLDEKAAKAALPPLVKGYLRLGGMVGEGAVIDTQFNTIDVCVVVETAQVTGRYLKHYASRPTGEEARP